MTTPRDGGGKGEGDVAGAQQLELLAGIGTEDLGITTAMAGDAAQSRVWARTILASPLLKFFPSPFSVFH